MTVTTNVPLTINPEAAARVAELGMQSELDQMLEHVRQTVPGLRAIGVQLAISYEDPTEEPGIIIDVFKDTPDFLNDPTWDQLSEWQLATFPTDVLIHFTFIVIPGTGYAR